MDLIGFGNRIHLFKTTIYSKNIIITQFAAPFSGSGLNIRRTHPTYPVNLQAKPPAAASAPTTVRPLTDRYGISRTYPSFLSDNFTF